MSNIFKVGEYVLLTNMSDSGKPELEGHFAKVLHHREARTPNEGFFYDVQVGNESTGFFERRLNKLPKGTRVLILATESRLGNTIPQATLGIIADTTPRLYGVRSLETGEYFGVDRTDVQPALTTENTIVTTEENNMQPQSPKLEIGTKVRATQDIKGNSGDVRWLKGAVGEVKYVGSATRIQCSDNWWSVRADQVQYWEVVPQDTPLTVCEPEPVPETLVGKRVKIRKSSTYYTKQGRTIEGKRRKGNVIHQHSRNSWVVVDFDDGYSNSYHIMNVKVIEGKLKVPKFKPEPVTADTPVGTKVRLKSNVYDTGMGIGAVGKLVRHDGDTRPQVQCANTHWFPHYGDLETVHPDTVITKGNGDAAL